MKLAYSEFWSGNAKDRHFVISWIIAQCPRIPMGQVIQQTLIEGREKHQLNKPITQS